MFAQGCVLVVLATLVGPVLTFFLDLSSFTNPSPSSHCSGYAEYNTLLRLKTNEACTNIDSVFTLLASLTTKEGTGRCRIEIIKILSDYFGPHATTPNNCQCQGTNVLQPYHTGHADHMQELRNRCFQEDQDYKNLYVQFFKPDHHHGIPACRTHHSIWYALKQLNTNNIDGSSCQKDFVFHLSFAFKHHADNCTCSSIHVTHNHQHIDLGHQGSISEKCLHHYHSYNVLQRLGETDGCLSANSVWHYLDDLQVKDPVCRETIQRQLADKYGLSNYYQVTVNCVCRSRVPLVNHQVHRMNNGSYSNCVGVSGSTYKNIEAALFSNIAANGCQNHNQLWTLLDGIKDECSHEHHAHCVDCAQDMIVRAAVQYPDSLSDSCVCSKVTTTSPPPTTTTTTTSPTLTTAVTTTTTTTTKTTTMTTTTTQPMPTQNKYMYTCKKFVVVEDIAMAIHTAHPNSSPCDQHAGGYDDALVLSTCNTSSPNTWRQGASVVTDCRSSTHSIPPFTPISTFNHGYYSAGIAKSGIFLECQNNFFKMVIQNCNSAPEIIQVDVNDDMNFYVIV